MLPLPVLRSFALISILESAASRKISSEFGFDSATRVYEGKTECFLYENSPAHPNAVLRGVSICDRQQYRSDTRRWLEVDALL
jgi:hypothetical protein